MNINSLVSLFWWVAIGVFFFWMMRRGGCGMSGHGGHGRSRDGNEGARSHSASGKPIDPVCGMEIDPQKAVGTRLVLGQTSFFCSQMCIDTFDKNPGAYAREGHAESSHHHRHAGC